MYRYTLFLCLVVLVALHVRTAVGQSESEPGFDKLKSLVGEWKGISPDGSPVRLTYELSSGGSALVETLEPGGDHPSMISVYHRDGNDLMMTHYCALQNQPRMRASVTDSKVKKIDFSFVDATNLSDPSAEHMHSLLVTFLDDDHIAQEWTLSKEGEKSLRKMEFERVK